MRCLQSFALTALLVACAPSHTRVVLRDSVIQLAPQESLSVVVMGDQGTGQPEQQAVARAMQQICQRDGCQLGFGLGDNFYPAGPRSADSPLFQRRFAALYGPLGIPFLMITGNHDETWMFSGDGANPAGADVQIAYSKATPLWVMPDRYYRAQVGNLLEVLAVDTTPLASSLPSTRPVERPGGSWETAQRAWLIEKTAVSPTQWKIVLGHHPLFSNAKHGDAGAYDRLPSTLSRGEAVRALYLSVCHDVDVIFSGHDHALQLFAPQPECPRTWQVVSGAAGQVGHQRQGNRPAAFQEYALPGFSWMKVTRKELLLRFFTVSPEGTPTLAFEHAIRK